MYLFDLSEANLLACWCEKISVFLESGFSSTKDVEKFKWQVYELPLSKYVDWITFSSSM